MPGPSPARGNTEAFFLVEFLAPAPSSAGAQRMADALQRAAAGLSGGGTHLARRGGVFIPNPFRCLPVPATDIEAAVRQARDVAGLVTANVHPVTPLLLLRLVPAFPTTGPSGHVAENTATSGGLSASERHPPPVDPLSRRS